jgi:antitoxin component YwqK of YwqJK toxin-antitoxin module
MKSFAFMIFLPLLTICCSRQVIITEDQFPEDTFYQTGKIKPYTGKCFVLFKGSQKIKEEMYFREGILNGIWISYFENGKIERKGEFMDGKFQGKWESWSETGQKLYEVNYKSDSLYGKYTIYNQSGKLKEQGEYTGNVKTGNWIYYNDLGNIISKN